jgi:hypothetical protein
MTDIEKMKIKTFHRRDAEAQRKSVENQNSLFSAVAFPLCLCASAANDLVFIRS